MKILVSPEDAELLVAHAWSVNARGYVVRWFKDGEWRSELLHRRLLGALGDSVVDHINGNKLDNRRENLRLCSQADNLKNRKIHSNNKLGVKGVYRDSKTGSFRAQIRSDGKCHRLGSFKTVGEAMAAYNAAASRLHGSFARLN